MKQKDWIKVRKILIVIAVLVLIYYLKSQVGGTTYSPFDGFQAFVGK